MGGVLLWGVFDVMKSFCSYFAGAALLAGLAVPAQAATETFAQFIQRSPSDRLFSYTNQDSGIAKQAKLTGNSVPVYFLLAPDGLPADLTGLQDATLSVDFLSNLGTTGVGSSRVQLFDTITAGSIVFTRDTAAAEGNGTRTNLLTVSFSNAELDASQNGGSFTFKSNANSVITFSSDFLSFNDLVSKDFSFSFSGADPTFSSVIGNSGRNIVFSGSGTFASDPAPVVIGTVPEPASWAMMVVGFGAVGGMVRRRQKANVRFA